MTTIQDRFRLRRGTAANLAAVNEVPLDSEIVIESDTGTADGARKFKIGDGVTPWNALPYFTLVDTVIRCRLATAAALPANTYSNGSSGVGATMTMTATGVLTVDGVATGLGDVLLVANEATSAHNGVYQVTTAGAVGVAAVLTRFARFVAPGAIPGRLLTVGPLGTANANTAWQSTTAAAPTVGTTSITFARVGGGGGGGAWGTITGTLSDQTDLKSALDAKADASGVTLSGRVATYSALPTSGLTAGNAYLVDADSLVYVWNGSAFPANGSGLSVSGSLVASAVVTGSAATDLTVTGLDLNAHHDYRILVSGKNNNASSFDAYLYFNGDTTNANYGRQSLYGLGSTAGAARSTSPVFDTVGASSDFDLVATMVKSPSGWPAVMGAQSAGFYTGLTHTNFVIRRNNSANVTSLTYHASVAGALAVGTEIKVYRR